MPRFATATVTEILVERPGLQRVDTDAGRAYVLTGLIGPVAVGDRVVLNATAVDLGLGTGGWHVVHWNLARDAWSRPGPGHIVKLRYTSLQHDAGAAEEDHPGVPASLPGIPVVACSLHSQVAVVAAVVRHLRPGTRIAYVMTDGAALPLALSDLVHGLRERGVLDVTVTAAHALGGRVALCARASSADPRPRHLGVSHHVRTILGLAAVRPAVPLPAALAGEVGGATVGDGPHPPPLLHAPGLAVT